METKSPNSLNWADGSIHVTVMLTSHKTEARIVTELRFTCQEERKDEENNPISPSNGEDDALVVVTRSDPIDL